MGIVDLDLLFQSPEKDARIIGGKGEEESSKGQTMVVKNVLKNLIQPLGKKPFYRGEKMWPLEMNPKQPGRLGAKVGATEICAENSRCKTRSTENYTGMGY